MSISYPEVFAKEAKNPFDGAPRPLVSAIRDCRPFYWLFFGCSYREVCRISGGGELMRVLYL